jgi:protein-L-isoaspartate(D-aspartate) O-methyltransferase
LQGRSAELRRAYAAKIARLAGVRDPRVEEAFAAVPREDYCGPPPWFISGGGFGLAAKDDPAGLYDDVLVAIDAGRGINNGQPSLHALCIDALAPKVGERVVQIGAGAGYYTAILARLVGPTGKVMAYEIEQDIANRARANLGGFPQVEVRARSGVDDELPKADVIYVNAAATHPARVWLDALNPGGRLLFPLHAARSSGAMLMITRPTEGDVWAARFLCGAVFIACQGAQDAAIGWRLDEAFRHGGSGSVRSLRFGGSPSRSDWLRGDGWALSTEAPG